MQIIKKIFYKNYNRKSSNKKIIFLFNVNIKKQKKLINKLEDKKIIINIPEQKIKINKIKNLNKKYNIIINNKIKNNLFYLKKYFYISNEIIFFIKPEIKYIKKFYFIINKLEKEYKIDKNKIKIIIEKNNKKNEIYFLIIKSIFKDYKKIIAKRLNN